MSGAGALFRLVLGHAGDAADPELLHWIKDQMDAILGLPPWAVVAMMGAIILLIPAAVISVYLWQQRRPQQLPAPDEIHPGEH
jgi:uncharacterized iron-regulated membrane protein